MTEADAPADATPAAPPRRIPVWVTAVSALLVGALIGVGGYALLDRDRRLAATEPAPSGSPAAAPGAHYQPVKDLCRYVDPSAFGKAAAKPRTGDPDGSHCFVVFAGDSGFKPPGNVVDASGGMFTATAEYATDADAARKAYTALQRGSKDPTAVDGIGDEAFRYTSTQELEGGPDSPTVITLTLVVRHDNLVLELTYQGPVDGSDSAPTKNRRTLEKIATTTLKKLAAA